MRLNKILTDKKEDVKLKINCNKFHRIYSTCTY